MTKKRIINNSGTAYVSISPKQLKQLALEIGSDVEIETTLVNGINTIIIQNPVDHGYRFIKFSPEQYEKFKHLLPMEEENNETNN